MSKHLDHRSWVEEQISKYLGTNYRNVFIHSSIIEGILVTKSGKYRLQNAIDTLAFSHTITPSEATIFGEIKDLRDSLAHEIFKNGGLSQDAIYHQLIKPLMAKIRKAYIVSPFLQKELFEKYKIVRPDIIAFNPAPSPEGRE